MKRIILFLCLLCLLPALAPAQYVQPTNAPIYDARKTHTPYGIINYAGTALAADSAIVIMPDSTFSRTAYSIKIGSVNTMWDPAQFMNATLLRPIPRDYEGLVTGGQDSVLIRDRRSADTKYIFVGGANNLLGGTSITSLATKNGWWVFGTSSGVIVYDWLNNTGWKYNTSGVSIYKSTDPLTNRNAGSGWLLLNSSPATVSNTVLDVFITDDPLGGIEPITGRPLPRIQVIQNNNQGLTISDAGISNLYTASGAGSSTFRSIYGFANGDIFYTWNNASTMDRAVWSVSSQTVTASGFGESGWWSNTSTGSLDLPFGDATVFNRVVALPNASMSDNAAPLVAVATSSGLFVSHASRRNSGTTGTYGLTFTIDATRRSAMYTTTADSIGWGLGDTTNVWGKSLTRIGTGAGTTLGVSAVIGQGATLDGGANSGFYRYGDESLRMGTGDWAYQLWFKSNSATNTGASLALVNVQNGVDRFMITMNDANDGQLRTYITDDGGATSDVINWVQDIKDANWHFAVSQRNGSTLELWCDGKMVGSTTITAATASIDPDSLEIGGYIGTYGSNRFPGTVNQFQKYPRALTANEIKKLYEIGLDAISHGVDPHDGLDTSYVAGIVTDPFGKIFATWGSGNGLRDSVTIWDENFIPIRRIGSPGGSIKTVAILTTPGSDSVSVVIGTDAKTYWRQTDPKIADLASNYRPTYPDHEGWARHVSTPGDSGTWVEGGMRISSADSLARFSNLVEGNGNLGVGKNMEVRGTAWIRTTTTPSADIAELFAAGPGAWVTKILSPAPNVLNGSFRLPALARLDSGLVIRDNDSTRTYSGSVARDNVLDKARVTGSWAVSGMSDTVASVTVRASGVEAGDTLRYHQDSTTVAVRVTQVQTDTVTLAAQIPSRTPFKVYPPSLSVKYIGCNIQPGDVCILGAAALRVKGSAIGAADVGKKGWIVSTDPASFLGSNVATGIPLAQIGSALCTVSADSGAIAVGDALTVGSGKKAVKLTNRATQWPLGWAMEVVSSGTKLIKVVVGN